MEFFCLFIDLLVKIPFLQSHVALLYRSFATSISYHLQILWLFCVSHSLSLSLSQRFSHTSTYAFCNMPSNSNNNTQTKGLDCEAQDNCRVVKEEKNGKKFIRFVTCRICTKSYHALCVNYQNLSDHEFAKGERSFLLHAMFQFC